jgi:hypothetical protein
VHIRDLTDAGGAVKEGISVMLEQEMGRSTIRKRVESRIRTLYTE